MAYNETRLEEARRRIRWHLAGDEKSLTSTDRETLKRFEGRHVLDALSARVAQLRTSPHGSGPDAKVRAMVADPESQRLATDLAMLIEQNNGGTFSVSSSDAIEAEDREAKRQLEKGREQGRKVAEKLGQWQAAGKGEGVSGK